MSRYAKDLLPLFKVLIKILCKHFSFEILIFQILVDPKKRSILKLDEKTDVRKLKYYYIRESGEHKVTPVSNELQCAMSKVVRHFENIAESKPTEINLHGTNKATKL